MAILITRAGKGSPLTNAEMDTNLDNLNNDKLEVSAFNSTADAWILNKSIDSLSDVDITTASPLVGNTIIWNGTKFVPGDSFNQTDFNNAFALKNLDDLADVDTTTTSPLIGQTIIWDGNKFVPGDSFNDADFAVAIAATSINALSDVDTATQAPTEGQTIVWDGSNFVPSWAIRQEAQGTVLTTDPTVIDAFDSTVFRSGEYNITLSTPLAFHSLILRVMHDGVNAYVLQFGDVIMGPSNGLGGFDVRINGGLVELVITAANANTDIRYFKQLTTINGNHLGFGGSTDLMQGSGSFDLTYSQETYDLIS